MSRVCVLVTYTRYLNWRYLKGVGTYHSHSWNVCVNTHARTHEPRATVYQSQNTLWTAYHNSERHDYAHSVFVFIPSTEYINEERSILSSWGHRNFWKAGIETHERTRGKGWNCRFTFPSSNFYVQWKCGDWFKKIFSRIKMTKI